MPACKDCKWFNSKKITCDLAPDSVDKPHETLSENKAALRACRTGIIYKYMGDMKGGVLEVGHGMQSLRGYFAPRKDSTWYGVDPRWPDNLDRFHYGASVHDMPFNDDFFDWVIGFETMEHWGEGKLKLKMEDCIKEIHRVMKPKAKLLLTAPFYVHGTDDFFYGRCDEIKRYFEEGGAARWSEVCFEEWRKEYEPLQPLFAWEPRWQRGSYREVSKVRARYLVDLIGDKPSSWKLEILATKA